MRALSHLDIIMGEDESVSRFWDSHNPKLLTGFVTIILNYSELVPYYDTIFMIGGESYVDQVSFEDFNVNTSDPKKGFQDNAHFSVSR